MYSEDALIEMSSVEWLRFREDIERKRKLKRGGALWDDYVQRYQDTTSKAKTIYLYSLPKKDFESMYYYITVTPGISEPTIAFFRHMDKKRKSMSFASCFPN